MHPEIRVLLIEDDEDDFVITRKLLRQIEGAQYKLEWITSFEAGLDALLAGDYDICLCDYRLGEHNGIDLIREAFNRGCNKPIILLTGQADRQVDLEAARAGASDYMIKGQITPDVLERSIRYSTERKKIEVARDFAIESARQLEEKYLRVMVEQSEEKYRSILETIEEGYFEIDLDGRFTFLNDAFCRGVAYPKEELLGRNFREFVDQKNSRKLFGAGARIFRTGQPVSQIHWDIPLNSDARRFFESSMSLINSASGEPAGFRGLARDITARKQSEQQLLHDAFHDGLTGLANRNRFMDHLRTTIERNRRRTDAGFAVLFLDFDRFKVINDSLGHIEGDNLLKMIAGRLQNALRPGDLVARLGGDEFTILITELADENHALEIAEQIQEEFKVSFDLGGHEVFTSASIGIALSSSGHVLAEDMLRDADIAMYRAKSKGKAQYQVFDQTMHKDAINKLQFETEMRRAFARGQFCLYYQPVINIETNRLVGFEALVRWIHPERGMISPGEFIPVAEENGLIIPLGRWTLYESCRQMREWQMANPDSADMTISVNLSSREFLQSNLAEQVVASLEATRLSPRSLKLEITESYLIENSETAIKVLNRLREIGVEISLDDFGTGYSSLSYLHRLPVSYLKIDRSFVNLMVESEKNYEIVHTIIKLAQNLKMKVIAEGIETREQLSLLRQLSCEYGQGYFFSKPIAAEAARQFIESQRGVAAMVANQTVIDLETFELNM